MIFSDGTVTLLSTWCKQTSSKSGSVLGFRPQTRCAQRLQLRSTLAEHHSDMGGDEGRKRQGVDGVSSDDDPGSHHTPEHRWQVRP